MFFFLPLSLFSTIKIEMYFYMPNTQLQNVQWQHAVWGTRVRGGGGIFVPANKCTHVIFCSCKIRYLGQGVRSFLVGLSGDVVFFFLFFFCASSSVCDKWKPFDFPSKERVRAWGNCELCWAECMMPPTTRGEKTLIKQFWLIIIQFSFLFLFSTEEPACHFRWEWLDIAALSTEAYCCMFCHYSMSLFFMTFRNVTYLPVEISIIPDAYCHFFSFRLKTTHFFICIIDFTGNISNINIRNMCTVVLK